MRPPSHPRASVARTVALALFAFAMACGPSLTPGGDTEAEDTGATPGTTAPGVTSDGSGPAPNTSTSTSTSTSTTTTADPDDGSDGTVDPRPDLPIIPCDFFEQDCDEGFKCVPFGFPSDEDFTGLRCVPVAEDGQSAGDPCSMFDHTLSGFDDCDASSMCAHLDEDTFEGTCLSFCFGDENNPLCADPDYTCRLDAGPSGLCFAFCDPLLQDCAKGMGCYPAEDPRVGPHDGYAGICLNDLSMGSNGPGAWCDELNGCAPLSFCAAPSRVPGCENPDGCCTSYCALDVPDPHAQCMEGQECRILYSDPWGLQAHGACSIDQWPL